MSLLEHADAAQERGHKLIDLFYEDEIYAPQIASLSKASETALRSFRDEHHDVVAKVAAATLAEGKALLADAPPEDRFWLIAAAAQMAFETAAILRAVDRELRPTQPPQHMIGSVQKVLNAPQADENYLWPFPVLPPRGD